MPITEQEFVTAALRGRSLDLLVSSLAGEQLDEFVAANQSLESAIDYHLYQNGQWMIPEQYQNFDMLPWLVGLCNNDVERQRVEMEWALYQQKGLVPVLQSVKYVVDTMRANNLVWGVGRGSSVASFILYLIGVHKIHSIEWDLDPTEFLR